MDESAPASTRGEDGAENKPCDGDTTSENNAGPPTEDTADRVGVFCCRDCGEAFREEAAYLEHRQQHPEENVYLNEQSDGLRNAEKDSETPLFCTICSLSFVELSEFHSHMKETHDQRSQEESDIQINSGIPKQHSYECPDCGKSYVVIGHFLNHRRSHSQPTKSVFNELEDVKKKSFQCESCGRNYSRASALDAHRRCHEEKLVKSNRSSRDATQTGESVLETNPSEIQTENCSEKRHKCSCGKSFSALMRLKTHQRFSRNSLCSPEEMIPKPKKSSSEFYCNECQKAFSGHIALFNHQRWHANHSDDCAQRFPCEECGKVFMTLTFYYRHQRTAHSDETPAKSFLHQVCQLQKKAFECKSCGLKFSRASALHSHELLHTDVYKETEEAAQRSSSLPSQDQVLESGMKENLESSPEVKVQPESFLPPSMAEETYVNDTDEDMESYEPGDFNVQVISASESEDEPVQDVKPDLELLCESDQDVRDDEVSTGNLLISKSEIDLKIVQVDFEQADEQCALIASEAENTPTEERHDCPECYRWFTNPSSLRVHRMWHGVHRRRNQQTQVNITCEDCGLKFTNPEVYKTHLHQHALEEEEEDEEEEAKMHDSTISEIDVEDDGASDDGDGCDVKSLIQTNPVELIESVATVSLDDQLRKVYTCLVCGKIYTYLVSFKKHLLLHDAQPTAATNLILSEQKLKKYECPDCGMSFRRRPRLINHLRVHKSRQWFKPSCNQCNRTFSTVKSWAAHIELHKRNPFWCLSCAQGFRDEASLDEHMQSHGPRRYNSSNVSAQLRKHVDTDTAATPFICKFCGRKFSHRGRLIFHQKIHLKCHNGSRSVPQETLLTNAAEGPEENADMEENVLKSEGQSEGSMSGEQENSEESDCGEPVHQVKVFKLPAPSDEIKSDTVESETGRELDEKESQETDLHREHKYWEWECIECDTGFDEVEKLHLHYMKHATGEVPIPQDDSEGGSLAEA
ncbi:zinc finger protein 420 isoform X2 [Acanthochromis polyacanthus]|uniref:zinc finger protein 420 isoform X2 n=1 Tax=Acanthochromis polyacanthus TaxID=80966 RepID=UPI002234ABF0|nr:zinc finger protein 420 isoform X2 [Acanthochromis polyacanthus]